MQAAQNKLRAAKAAKALVALEKQKPLDVDTVALAQALLARCFRFTPGLIMQSMHKNLS